MNIVIAGSGNVGSALADGWRKAGHDITFAMREPDSSRGMELKQNGFGAVPLGAAATSADVIALAVPWSAVQTTIEALGSLAGKVLIDTTDPLRSTRELALGFGDSGGETVARLSPGARVVKAFSTTGAGNMADSQYPGGRLMMAVAGDDVTAKQIVMTLVAELGFDPIDTGPLAMSRYLEPLAMLWINLAYTQRLGPDIGFALLRRSPPLN
ncbi:MAG: 8-hydroxy-5-deazaflavin:NADPH oxidoreductase [Hyphomicrobiales bacterium]|jgi:predicted dinucleotide-binding enzyme